MSGFEVLSGFKAQDRWPSWPKKTSCQAVCCRVLKSNSRLLTYACSHRELRYLSSQHCNLLSKCTECLPYRKLEGMSFLPSRSCLMWTWNCKEKHLKYEKKSLDRRVQVPPYQRRGVWMQHVLADWKIMQWPGSCPLRAGGLVNPDFTSLIQEQAKARAHQPTLAIFYARHRAGRFSRNISFEPYTILWGKYSYYKWGNRGSLLVRGRRSASTGELLRIE